MLNQRYIFVVVLVCSFTGKSSGLKPCHKSSDCPDDQFCWSLFFECYPKVELGEKCYGHNGFCKGRNTQCDKESLLCVCDNSTSKDGKPLYKFLHGRCVSYNDCDYSRDCPSGEFCSQGFCWVNPLTHKIYAPIFYIGMIAIVVGFVTYVVAKRRRFRRLGI